MLPLLFVPYLFSVSAPFASGAVRALDQALPHAKTPIAIVLNLPAWSVVWFQGAMRAAEGEVGPPAYALYAGSQSVAVERVDDRSLELHVAHSWLSTPFEAQIRDVSRAPFRAGDRIAFAHFTVEVREVNAAGAPTRARFTFDRALEDPELTFRYWEGLKVALWTPPRIGGRVQLSEARTF